MVKFLFSKKTKLILVSFGIFLSLAQNAMGQNYIIDPETYVKTLVQSSTQRLSPYTSDMFNESIDLSTGALSFYTVDVALNGNSNLPVQVGRRFGDLGNIFEERIVVDAPVLDGVAYCDNIIPSPYEAHWADGWAGLTLKVPNGPKRRALRVLSSQYNPNVHESSNIKAVTKDNWQFECLSTSNYLNFLVHAPNGDKYYFDIESGDYTNLDPYGYPWIQEVGDGRLYASKIEDVHGNWVKYEYKKDSGNRVTGVSRIHANDGREITLSYLPGNSVPSYLDTVTANTRVWDYQYATGPGVNGTPVQSLHRVVQPDGKFWEYTSTYSQIQRPGYPDTGHLSLYKVKHPYGAEIEYDFQDTVNGVYKLSCAPQSQPSETEYFSNAVIQKRLKVGVNTQTWNYLYEQDNGTCNGAGINKTKWREVTSPVGVKRKLYFNREYSSKIKGKLEEEQIRDANNLLVSEVSYEYITGPKGGDSGSQDLISAYAVYNKRTIREQDADTYTTEYEYNLDPLLIDYSFGRPTQAKTYSNINTAPRVTDTTYEHNTGQWILGLPKTIHQNGRNVSNYIYTPKGQKAVEGRYGVLHATFLYNPDGTISRFTDAEGRRTKAYLWKRGTPQRIEMPDNATNVYQYVDDNGWLTSTKDGRGYITNYARDNMGRLTTFDPPGSFTDTTIAYSFPANGGAVQTITKGASKSIVTYDSMFRPVLETSKDTSTGWESFVNSEYNAAGQLAFKSQPSAYAAHSGGTDYTYDGLGRMIQASENMTGGVTISSGFLSGHRRTSTDGAGNITTTTFRGYGGPNSKEIVKIEQPENVTTDIALNIWGEIETATQSGGGVSATQYYYYDSRRRLCRHVTPEAGHNIYKYDNAGRLTDYARGVTAGTGCAAPSGNERVELNYWPNGQLKETKFTDPSTPDIYRDYDANGNITWMFRGAGNDAVRWFYEYDEMNNLTREKLIIDQRLYDTSYTYNSQGHLTQKLLPTGMVMNHNVDGLGRDVNVKIGSSYLGQNAVYHAAGLMTNMTFGNGFAHTLTPNARLQPYRIQATKLGYAALDMTYSYDNRGKVSAVLDLGDSANSRSYGYDDIGRLTSASGPWINGSFNYDALGNLTYKNLSAKKAVTNTYDPVTNRLIQSFENWNGGGSRNRTLSYDARGNVSALGNISFNYDRADQPDQMSLNATGEVIDYMYDGHLKRVKAVTTSGGAMAMSSGTGTGTTSTTSAARTSTFGWGFFKKNRKEKTAKKKRETDAERAARPWDSAVPVYPGSLSGFDNYTEIEPSADSTTHMADVRANIANTDSSEPSAQARNSGVSGPQTANASPGCAGPTDETLYNVYNAAGQLVIVDKAHECKMTMYIHGMGRALVRIEVDTAASTLTRTYLHNDHLGSAAAGTSHSANVLWREQYTPYGEKLLDSPANQDQGSFTGHIDDAKTGLTYMQARYYDPAIGRFLSIDPVRFVETGHPGMFNRYSYTLNDPVNMIDPDGEWATAVLRGSARPVSKQMVQRGVAGGGLMTAVAYAPVLPHEQLQAAVMIAGALLNEKSEGPIKTKGDGKVDKLPESTDIGDSELEEAIEQLGTSIGVREAENKLFGPGNPNGTPEQQEKARRYEGHKERISRETDLKEKLKGRKRMNDIWEDLGK